MAGRLELGRALAPIMAHHMAAQPGSRIGAYEILGLLGAGGMGEVYRARHTRLQRDVAIKIVPDALANDAGAQIAAGLAAAHSRGVVHRDLKRRTCSSRATAAARFSTSDWPNRRHRSPPPATEQSPRPTPTSPGTVLGTVGYMSPKQVRGEPVE